MPHAAAITTASDRHLLDRYDSPRWMTDTLLHALKIRFPEGTVFLECCVGGGSIADVLKASGYKVITTDIDPACNPHYVLDMTQEASWVILPPFDYVVSNLPFNVADSILRLAIPRSKGVMVLLRKTWDEAVEGRFDLLEQYPWSHKISMPRFKFRRKKDAAGERTGGWQTDSTPIDWFMWMPQETSLPAFSIYSAQKISRFSRFTQNPDQEAEVVDSPVLSNW